MPNHVMNEVIFTGLSPVQIASLREKILDEVGQVDFGLLLPIPLNCWMGSVGAKHENAFPYTALDWCTRNWSTKWNAYSTQPIEESTNSPIVRFETAWRPPYGWLVAIFNHFKISFAYNWLSEGEQRGHSGRFENQDLRASLSEIKAALGLHQDSGVADCVAKITAMTEALRWYASPRTWNQWLPDSAGERARKALGG